MRNVTVMHIEQLAVAYRVTRAVHLNVVNVLNVRQIMIVLVIVLALTTIVLIHVKPIHRVPRMHCALFVIMLPIANARITYQMVIRYHTVNVF